MSAVDPVSQQQIAVIDDGQLCLVVRVSDKCEPVDGQWQESVGGLEAAGADSQRLGGDSTAGQADDTIRRGKLNAACCGWHLLEVNIAPVAEHANIQIGKLQSVCEIQRIANVDFQPGCCHVDGEIQALSDDTEGHAGDINGRGRCRTGYGQIGRRIPENHKLDICVMQQLSLNAQRRRGDSGKRSQGSHDFQPVISAIVEHL